MTLKLQKYSFSKSDTDEIKKIGYVISSSDTTKLEVFIQKKFPNFNLLKLLQVIETQFTSTTTKPVSRVIKFDNKKSCLRIEYSNQYSSEDDALLFVREFSIVNKEIEIKHEYCVIPKDKRGNGLIKPVFQESLQQYLNIKAKRIKVHAALSGGGYTWAKHGFVAIEKSEIDLILNKAQTTLIGNELTIVKKIYDSYYTKNPNGKSFPIELWAALDFMKPILMGSNWHGEIDLENKEQFHNFKDYVFR